MSTPERYFIRPDYVTNEAVTTMDHLSGRTYWNAERIKTASYFQFHVYKYVAELAARTGARRLFDVGCGPGTKLAIVRDLCPMIEITGIDQPAAIEYCRSTHDFGEWISDDFEAREAKWSPDPADIVVCADVIEHVANPDLLLDYIRGLAGPETRIVLSTPERDIMRGADCTSCSHPQHVREWNSQELRTYLEHSGFVVDELHLLPSYRFAWDASFISRDLKRLLSGRPRRNNQMIVFRRGAA